MLGHFYGRADHTPDCYGPPHSKTGLSWTHLQLRVTSSHVHNAKFE